MATRSELNQFSCDEMCDLLTRKGEIEDDTISVFRENRVTGRAFLELTDEDLKELVTRIGERKAVKRLLEGYLSQKVCRDNRINSCLLYTSPSPRDATLSRMPSSA